MNVLLRGEVLMIGEAFLFALFPVLSKLALNGEISVLVLMIITWSFAGVFFAVLLFLKKEWGAIKNCKNHWRDILWAGFFLGAVVNGFIFWGLEYTTAGNAALIGLSETLFSYLFFSIWKKEKEKLLHIIGSAFMIVGVCIAFWDNLIHFSFNIGDILVFIGFALAPLGNFFQQRAARSHVPNSLILFIRILIVVPFFLLLFFLTGEKYPDIENIQKNFFTLFFLGFFILGFSKLLWIKGIELLSVPKAVSISSVYPVFTFVFAYFFLGEIPSLAQIISLFPMGIGIYLLMKR
jgi:drug/metabolite transporter (DMT)-like permease